MNAKTEFLTIGIPIVPDQLATQAGHFKRCFDFTYLGSRILDTKGALRQGRQLAWMAARRLRHVFHGNASNQVKSRLFVATVESVLFYSAEALVLTPSLSKDMDATHRSLLRYSLGIRWPNVISSSDLYLRANLPPATKRLTVMRLRLLGHTIRTLTREKTPLVLALTVQPTEPLRPGRPRMQVHDQLRNDLALLGVKWNDAPTLANNKKLW